MTLHSEETHWEDSRGKCRCSTLVNHTLPTALDTPTRPHATMGKEMIGMQWESSISGTYLSEYLFISKHTNLAVLTADAIRRALGPRNQFTRAGIAARIITFLNRHRQKVDYRGGEHITTLLFYNPMYCIMIRGVNHW